MIIGSKASETRGWRPRLAKGTLFALALAAVAALALLVSACGGSSGEAVAHVGSGVTTTTSAGASSKPNPAAYSACMRKNGVPKFPDPDAQGRLAIQGGPGLDPNSPQFKAAEKACKKFMPRGGGDKPNPAEQAKGVQEALKHSACMRKNGVPNFPDPKANAEGGIDLSPSGSGFDPNSPQYKAAEKACQELLPGGAANKFSPAPGQGATP